MSAIVGVFNWDGQPVEPLVLQHMLDAINFFGPDGRGVWTDGPVGLGHLLLEVTPQSKFEQLPMVNAGIAITADVRIDNRADLLPRLRSASPYDRVPDSALIVHAYERWGMNCLIHLVGDYGFAIWDRRQQTLLLACDHISTRPVYYALTRQRIVFATDVRALWTAGVPARPNEEVIAAYLDKYPFAPRDETLYTSIISGEQRGSNSAPKCEQARGIRMFHGSICPDSDRSFWTYPTKLSVRKGKWIQFMALCRTVELHTLYTHLHHQPSTHSNP